jgi:predicted ArsR family transcriptional regulator
MAKNGEKDTTETPRTIELTDPRMLRAVAHPLRLSLVGLLRREGAMTATQAAEILGESDALCSFHLRQLAKYGLVEEAGGGRGRERPWRASSQGMRFSGAAETPEMAAATELLESVLAERYFELLLKWVHEKPTEPFDWQEAALFGDSSLYVTPAELTELGEQINVLLAPFEERRFNPELRPSGARSVTFLQLAFPYLGPAKRAEK